MTRYARLKELGFDADLEVREVGMDFSDKYTEGDAVRQSAEAKRAQHLKSIHDHIYSVQSHELASEIFGKLQNSKGFPDDRLAQQQQKLRQEKQNIENGNPNVCSPDRTTQPNVGPICSHSSTATGASLQEQQFQGGGGGRGGASPSGRWVGRNIEERSGRWRTVGCESHSRDNSASVLDSGSIASSAPSSRSTCSHWAPSIERGTLYRDREPAQDHQSREALSFPGGTQPQQPQSQEKHSCSLHSPCVDVRQSQRFSQEWSLQESQFGAPLSGSERRPPPSVTHPTSDAFHWGSSPEERGPNFQRGGSVREASGLQRNASVREAPGLQRSSSTRDTARQRSEMAIENWIDPQSSKTPHSSEKTKHRVSFSLTENHEMEAQKLREKLREPTAHCMKSSQEKQQPAKQQQPLRYNYEQPGFVEREKENICTGKAYTIYGVKEVKDCSKGSSGHHHHLVRAFSVRENGTTYAKMPRAYSVNAGGGRHIMPMECGTCGSGGIGIFFLGVPGDDGDFCKSCKSCSESGRSCGENKPPKKKKSILDYCRKILRLPQKSR